MTALKLVNLFVLSIICLSQSMAAPEPGFLGKKHEHFVIHVPYKVHTVHHHHVEKVPIYKEVPVIKHVPVIKEVHVPVVKEVVKEVHVPVHVEEQKGWSSGWY